MLRSTSIVRNGNYRGGGGKRQSGCSLSVFRVETRAMSWITSGSKKTSFAFSRGHELLEDITG